jgi:CspA family cold shock protein
MQAGKVKWFNNVKGYGFINSDDSEVDLFAHFSAIVMDGYKTLKAGQSVVFETQNVDRGIHAINIQPCASHEEALPMVSEQTSTSS